MNYKEFLHNNGQNYFRLFSNCVLVKGYTNSTLCDLQFEKYIIISTAEFELINFASDKTLNEVISSNEIGITNNAVAFLESLEELGFGRFQKKSELALYPDMDFSWDDFSEITNSILDISEESNYPILSAVEELNSLRCKHIQIRYYHSPSIIDFESLFLKIESSFFSSSEFLIRSQGADFINKIINVVKDSSKINFLYFHGGEKNYTEKINNITVLHSSQEIINEENCGIISQDYFSINLRNYSESLNHNSCLNRKISLDSLGRVKNCPSCKVSFGKYGEVTFSQILKRKKIRALWGITKDQISVCKDCEFRFICTDCRAYRKDMKDQLSKPMKCNYNPYLGIWE